MSFILNIETSGKNCSVAIAEKGQVVVLRELNSEQYVHAEKLHLFINSCLEELKIDIGKISAIAVSEGPGSYTGLRIGVAAAKGLAYALSIPMIAVSSLLSLVIAAKDKGFTGVYCPMIDARRMEVYTCFYKNDLERIGEVQSVVMDDGFRFSNSETEVFYFGDGAVKCQSILPANFKFVPDVCLSASNIAEESYMKFLKQDFVNLAYFEPFYLKDFIPGKPKKIF